MRLLINAIAGVLILSAGVGGYVLFGQKAEVPKNVSDKTDLGVAVDTAEVQAWDQPLVLSVDGEAMTYRVITVGAEVAGRIVEKTSDARGGTIVTKGTPLFRIDDLNYRLDIDRLSAEKQKTDEEVNAVAVDLQNIESLIELAKEEWQLQKNQLDRIRTAFDRKATTESELDAARRQELAARNSLQTLQNQKKTLAQQKKTKQAGSDLAAAELRRAEADLARCVVVAPITGTIVDDLLEQGDYIKSGEPVIRISDSSRMEVKCNLQADELNWILQQFNDVQTTEDTANDLLRMPKVACEVAYDLGGVEAIWDGVLSRYEGTGMDRDTRTFPCRILVQQPRDVRLSDSAGGRPIAPPPTLLSGMYVTVRIPVTSPVPLLRLPTEAIRPGGQLWVVRDAALQIMTVSVAATEGDFAIVRAADTGLRQGDQVIVSPLAAVSDGMAVSPAEGTDGSSPREGLPIRSNADALADPIGSES